MITKFISLATAIVTLDVYLQSQLSSNDPLFSFISNNLAANMLMVTLAAAAVAVSFRKRFDSWYGYAAASAGAAMLIIVGGGGFFFSGFLPSLWMVALPLNYLLMLEFGVIMGVCALSYKHQPRPASARLPRPPLPFKLAFPVPRIPHFPFTRPTVTDSN